MKNKATKCLSSKCFIPCRRILMTIIINKIEIALMTIYCELRKKSSWMSINEVLPIKVDHRNLSDRVAICVSAGVSNT